MPLSLRWLSDVKARLKSCLAFVIAKGGGVLYWGICCRRNDI